VVEEVVVLLIKPNHQKVLVVPAVPVSSSSLTRHK
jgi:hypothetical protein